MIILGKTVRITWSRAATPLDAVSRRADTMGEPVNYYEPQCLQRGGTQQFIQIFQQKQIPWAASSELRAAYSCTREAATNSVK